MIDNSKKQLLKNTLFLYILTFSSQVLALITIPYQTRVLTPETYGVVGVAISVMTFATVYKGNIIKNLIMDCQSYTKYRPNETTGGIFVSWRRKEELPTGA